MKNKEIAGLRNEYLFFYYEERGKKPLDFILLGLNRCFFKVIVFSKRGYTFNDWRPIMGEGGSGDSRFFSCGVSEPNKVAPFLN